VIEDLIVSPLYWLILAAIMGAFYFALHFRPLDFKFFIALPIAQRIAHIALLPASYSSTLAFATLTGMVLIIGRYLAVQGIGINPGHATWREAQQQLTVTLENRCYIALAGLFLTLYFGSRLIFYPQFFSVLDLGERLQAQYDHRLIFALFLAAPPALTAVMVRWVSISRLTIWDKLLAVLLFVGYLSVGSKASIAPIFLTFFGVTAYLGRTGIVGRAVLVLAIIGIVGGVALSLLLPSLSASQLGQLVLYRIVANTEELEYLYVLGFQPDQYPFAGVGALVAPIAKVLGTTIDYTPGVWLYGQRFNNWTGFGPNSGFIIEFFGNLNFFGLTIPLFLGIAIGYCDRKLSVYGAVLLSIVPLAFMETLMFVAALGTHIILASLAKLVSAFLGHGTPFTSPSGPKAEQAMAARK
jgi:hypothetical protein